jgi:hypothetical protein
VLGVGAQGDAGSSRYTAEHFNTENGDTCHLVKWVVGRCGEMWQRCHTSREVRRMKDLHIEALVRQYRDEGGLDDCHFVQEYRYGKDINILFQFLMKTPPEKCKISVF